MTSGGIVHPPPRHRRPGATLYRYVAREAWMPTVTGLLGLTVVVLTTSLLEYSDLVINRGVGIAEVGQLLVFEAVPVAARILPFAVLIGVLVALGRMGADREILVLEACGVAAGRMVWPVVSFAGAMTVIALVLSLEVVPWAGARFDAGLEQLARVRPWSKIHAGVASDFGGWRLEVREVSPSGKKLAGVMLWIPEVGETIFARGARLEAGPEGRIEITMEHGLVILAAGERLRRLSFEQASTWLPESDAGLVRTARQRIPTLPLAELMAQASEWQPAAPNELPLAALELHRRLANPMATLVFGVMAVPLFLLRRNFSRSAGGMTGIAATVAYYGLVQLSEGLLQSGRVGPAVAAWLPDAAGSGLAVLLLVRALREASLGHAFDRPAARSWRALRRFGLGARPREGRVRLRVHRYALARYVARRFLALFLLSFSVLFVAYLLIDVMDRLAWFSEHGATTVEALRFYGARIWLLASRSVPMALLVATALTVSLLAVDGELIGMRTCGISAARATLPVLLLTLAAAPLYFVLNDVAVPRANALAERLKNTEIREQAVKRRVEQRRAGFWYRSGRQLLEAAWFDPEAGQASDVTIFELGEDGLPVSRVDAPRARHIGQGWWRLTEPRRIELQDGRLRTVPARRHAELGRTVQAEVDTRNLPVRRVAEEARAVEADGFDATPFWVDYQARLAEPFACVVLPALALFFAISGPPHPSPAQTLLVSGVLGVGYILLTAVASTLGRGGLLAPAVSAWAPVGLFGTLALTLGVRVWKRL